MQDAAAKAAEVESASGAEKSRLEKELTELRAEADAAFLLAAKAKEESASAKQAATAELEVRRYKLNRNAPGFNR